MILDFYILREFNKALIQWLFAFIGILLITEIFEMANTLINMEVPLLVSIEYFIYKIPLTAALVTPVAVLIATLFSLSGLAKTNEITAMKASGIGIYRIILPILLEAGIITLLSFAWQELVVPGASRQAEYIKKVKIKHKPIHLKQASAVSFYSSGNRLVNLKFFDGVGGKMQEVMIIKRESDNSPQERIDAKEGIWQDDVWHLRQGVRRLFNPDAELVSEFYFEDMPVDLDGGPDNIWEIITVDEKKPEEVSLRELWDYIKLLRQRGRKAEGKLVDFHLKFSFPLASFIIVLLGAPLALSTTRGGKVANFALAILIGFLYWGTVAVGRSLGYSGTLPPMLSTWAANLIFGGIGTYLLLRRTKT